MNAMIYAAGLGTRLYPITESKPKALVEVKGKPLLWYAIQNVMAAGATNIVINVHHFANQVIECVATLSYKDVTFHISDETDELLETGGGLLKAAPLFIPDLPILIYNADVLTNCNMQSIRDIHLKSNAMATLMVQNRQTSRYFLFDDENRLSGWENKAKNEEIIVRDGATLHSLAFNGIHMVNYAILDLLGPIRKFSITNGYLELAADHQILGWDTWQGQWFDVGTIEKLETANNQFESSRFY